MATPSPKVPRGTIVAVVLLALAVAATIGGLLGTASSSPGSTATTRTPGRSTTTTAAATATTSGTTVTTGTTESSSATTTWTVYHGDPEGSGVSDSPASFSSPTRAWTSAPLDGQVYGEPLEAAGRVFVATENDTVYALAADKGTVVWSTHLASPVQSGDLPCGDISPTVGVTGTPVVDVARAEIFVVADELVSGNASHHLVGLDIYSGKVLLNEPVDPPGTQTTALLQRTGLNLDDTRVVFGFGGNYGDCGSYHGWIVSVPVGGGPVDRYESDAAAGERQGAFWMGGAAPEVTPDGDIWVAAGNGSVTSPSPYDRSDAVIELTPDLHVVQYLAPSDWYRDNASDRDLGSTAPALLDDGTVVQVGKSATAYLLDRATLGGIGGQLKTAPVCAGGDADGGDAVLGTVVFVPCLDGLEALDTSASPPNVTVAWDAAARPSGPPIVAGGIVWSLGAGTLYGIDPSNGSTEVEREVGTVANHFPTPSVGGGLLLVPGGGDRVLAFAGSDGLPGPPSPP